MSINEPIDAVITWVDGNDKIHQKKRVNALAKLGKKRPTGSLPTRFNQCGELNYCLQSLLCFAPWLRTIFIVTDAQIPSAIKQLENTAIATKIKIVDHQEIFTGFANCLPNFNSVAIETVLWRINGLANRFIYLNDDCVIVRPVSPSDFFNQNKIVLRGGWKKQTSQKWRNYFYKLTAIILRKPYKPLSCSEHRTLQENSAKLAGWDKHFFYLPHIPFPLTRMTLADYFKKNPGLLIENISYPFRSAKQYWPISLAYHLALKMNDVIIDNALQAIAVNGACYSLEKIKRKLKQVEVNKQVAFICMQSLDLAPINTKRWLFDWLDNRLFSKCTLPANN